MKMAHGRQLRKDEVFMSENEVTIAKPKIGTTQDFYFAATKIKSMPKAEILAWYNRYRKGEKIQGLIDELNFCIRTSQFISLFKGVVVNDLKCPHCGTQMATDLESKSGYSFTPGLLEHTCLSCGHFTTASIEGVITSDTHKSGWRTRRQCHCANCMQQAKRKLEARKAKVIEAYCDQYGIQVGELEFVALEDIVGLLSLVRMCASESMAHINPPSSSTGILCPTTRMTEEVITNMVDHGLLNLDVENTPLESFTEKEDGYSWQPRLTTFQISIYADEDLRFELQEIPSLLQDYLALAVTEQQKQELPLLMRKIAIAECMQFMRHMLNEHGFHSYAENLNEKTEQLFDELLDKLSINQIAPCIWSAVRNAAAFTRNPSCKGIKHAYNTIQGKIREGVLKRLTGEWDSKPFSRNIQCPRSEISYALYLALGYEKDVGFTSRLDDIQLPDYWISDAAKKGRHELELRVKKLQAAMKKIAECETIFEAQDIAREASAEAGRIL